MVARAEISRRRRYSLPPSRLGLRSDGHLVVLLAVIAVGSLLVGGVALARVALPLTDSLQQSLLGARSVAATDPLLDVRSKVYSSDGTLLAVFHGEENREPVPLSRVPIHVQRAVIAIEDERFYSHDGVDVAALGRALLVNSSSGDIEQGGGTITMQLARNAYLRERSKTMTRKLQEIAVARSLERRLTKKRILEEYLNTVYFGWGAYGIQAAAEAYFGKPVERLTVSQGAVLAGLIKSPARLDPRRYLRETIRRRARVLAKMQAQGFITPAQERAALREPVLFRRLQRSNGIEMVADAGSSFVEHVKQRLLEEPALGSTRQSRTKALFEGGLRIQTTLDLRAQRAAEKAIRDVLNLRNDPSAALVSIEPATGAIRALTGGTDARGFNLASQGRRQPGSAFKPFALVAALEDGVSVQTRFDGTAPRSISLPGGGTWVVRNYEGSLGGSMSLLTATEFSVNVVYAQLVVDIGPSKVVGMAHRMGIKSHLDAFPSIALGALTRGVSPLEMASAYATLANKGRAMEPYAIQRVVGAGNRTIASYDPTGKQVLDAEIAAKATAVLASVVRNGTGRRAQELGRPAAAKTGTTDEYRDSWFVGFTPQLSTAVWIGFPKTSAPLKNIHGLPQVFGGSLPAEIWTRTMKAALAGEPVQGFPEVSLGPEVKETEPTTRTKPDELLRRRRLKP